MKLLILVDMQNDFIDGSLGTPEAQAIVPKVLDKIKNWNSPIIWTYDTHDSDYLNTQEGTKLPIIHCVKGTHGWEYPDEINAELNRNNRSFYTSEWYKKETFGCLDLAQKLNIAQDFINIEEIQICGLCTDICVVSNALLIKAACPRIPIICDASCCAGTTPENHQKALDIMKCCQIDIINN